MHFLMRLTLLSFFIKLLVNLWCKILRSCRLRCCNIIGIVWVAYFSLVFLLNNWAIDLNGLSDPLLLLHDIFFPHQKLHRSVWIEILYQIIGYQFYIFWQNVMDFALLLSFLDIKSLLHFLLHFTIIAKVWDWNEWKYNPCSRQWIAWFLGLYSIIF